MQQVVDLQKSERFEQLGVELLSISPDTVEDWESQAADFGIETPVLSDVDNRVANAYGVMRWGMPTGEPGHTFVLVDARGRVKWIKDYGAPENGGVMYVDPGELVPEIGKRL
jgi:peroxiredoxin